MTSIVIDTTTKEEQLKQLVTFAQKALEENGQVFELSGETQQEILLQLTEQSSELLATGAPEKDIEGFFATLANLGTKLKLTDDKVGRFVDLVSSALLSTKSKTELRLKSLVHFYNIGELENEHRFKVLKTILRIILEADSVSLLARQIIQKVQSLKSQLNLSPVQLKELNELFFLISDKLEPKSNASFAKLVTLLKELDDSQVQLPEIVDYARQIIVRSIQTPEVYQFDQILSLKAIQQLKAVKETEKLFELLEIFGSKGIDALQQFVDQNAAISEETGISKDDLFSKLRLLLLSSIGTLRNELSFDEIISNLKINEAELEEIVIQAIGYGILDARIDQINRSVVIVDTKPREFPLEWWTLLQQRLDTWQEHITVVQQAVVSINSSNPGPQHRRNH
eukprot:CAMPEP_0184331950 /NCGR_PEP_ID=MMETSP1089-20130417/1235_1 /TAXON_ID=38269 ORGANISM="Gloeochaete wittrockiana, Strain SAG46.84" /NCGR_SAMPLE_ID=MMETSP1089 /ASSEMBLY_ACC=CAM_ASM_000445 /LENGTH=396 /DNA_ID=CAMNT_0026655129 /DNA_START=83 /DNA_END=1273 /DNA_ORIENTATION=+